MINDAQREERKNGLFASDIARIMTGHGVQVALEKLGALEPFDFDDVIEVNIGWKAEPLILDAYENYVQAPVQRDIDTERHPEHSWMGCHRDATLLNKSNSPLRNAEVKTVGWYNRSQWGEGGDQIPDYVLWQTMAQMSICRLLTTDIPACFISWGSLKYLFLEQPPPINIYRVALDYELEEFMIKKCQGVWDCIQRGETPEPENLDDVKMIYSKAEDPEIEADPEILAYWTELIQVKEKLKAQEKRETELKFLIQKFMKKSGALILKKDYQVLATWKNDSDGDKFDVKQFGKDHPDLFRQYLKFKPGARKFLPKAPKTPK